MKAIGNEKKRMLLFVYEIEHRKIEEHNKDQNKGTS